MYLSKIQMKAFIEFRNKIIHSLTISDSYLNSIEISKLTNEPTRSIAQECKTLANIGFLKEEKRTYIVDYNEGFKRKVIKPCWTINKNNTKTIDELLEIRAKEREEKESLKMINAIETQGNQNEWLMYIKEKCAMKHKIKELAIKTGI